jgi:succinate-acetate transporter protein
MKKMENVQEVKIQTKEWSNPTAAGLVALAAVCFCFFGLLNGYFPSPGSKLVIGGWLIGGFVVQVIVAILDLKGNNHAGGNTFLFFSAFFMLATGIGMFVKGLGYGYEPAVDGYAWLALMLVLWLWTPAFFKKIGILSFIVVAIDIALMFIVLNDFGYNEYVAIGAWALLIAAIMAIYLSAAMVVNTAFGKKIYPM